jgi:hypothetical protein
VKVERQSELGREFDLAPRGFGRFFGAGFLSVWLCGWAAGETFAVWMLYAGARTLVTGEPLGSGQHPLQPGVTLAMGSFLLFWLSLWTLGGVAAIRELLKLTVQRDRVIVGSAGLLIMRSFGPFTRRTEIPRDALRRIYLTIPRGELAARTATGTVVLSSLGTPAERTEAERALRDEFRLDDGEGPVALPEGWSEIVDPEGRVAIVADPAARRLRARVATVLALTASAVAVLVVCEVLKNTNLIGIAVLACAVGLGLSWGAVRLALGRDEWTIESGRATLRRRFGANARDVFEGVALELTRTNDSRGAAEYTLSALAADTTRRRTIARVLHDPTMPRMLGRFLSERAGLELADRSTAEARRVDIEQMLDQLRRSGKFGRLAAEWIDRVQQSRRTPIG